MWCNNIHSMDNITQSVRNNMYTKSLYFNLFLSLFQVNIGKCSVFIFVVVVVVVNNLLFMSAFAIFWLLQTRCYNLLYILCSNIIHRLSFKSLRLIVSLYWLNFNKTSWVFTSILINAVDGIILMRHFYLALFRCFIFHSYQIEAVQNNVIALIRGSTNNDSFFVCNNIDWWSVY